jgi:hypothetical protein
VKDHELSSLSTQIRVNGENFQTPVTLGWDRYTGDTLRVSDSEGKPMLRLHVVNDKLDVDMSVREKEQRKGWRRWPKTLMFLGLKR